MGASKSKASKSKSRMPSCCECSDIERFIEDGGLLHACNFSVVHGDIVHVCSHCAVTLDYEVENNRWGYALYCPVCMSGNDNSTNAYKTVVGHREGYGFTRETYDEEPVPLCDNDDKESVQSVQSNFGTLNIGDDGHDDAADDMLDDGRDINHGYY